jgi:hypothetical protein
VLRFSTLGTTPGGIKARCPCPCILFRPRESSIVLAPGRESPNLERFSARQDRFPAPEINIVRGDILERFVVAAPGVPIKNP